MAADEGEGAVMVWMNQMSSASASRVMTTMAISCCCWVACSKSPSWLLMVLA